MALTDRLTERGVAVEPAPDKECLVFEKLGVTYQIHPDRVEGESPPRTDRTAARVSAWPMRVSQSRSSGMDEP